MTITRNTTLLVAAALLAGWLLAGSSSPTPTPADRPVLRVLARVARLGLWALTFAEPAPSATTPAHLVHAEIGADGHPLVNHREGW